MRARLDEYLAGHVFMTPNIKAFHKAYHKSLVLNFE